MKKILSTLFCFSALFLSSCSDDKEQEQDLSNTIGIVLFDPINEFRSLAIDYAVKKANALGCNYILKLTANPEQQRNDLQKLADIGVKTVVLGNQTDTKFLNTLIEGGMNIIFYEDVVECDYACVVSGDNPGLGERAGEFFNERSNVSKIVALTVPTEAVSGQRISSFKSKLSADKTVVEIPIVTYSDAATLLVLDQIIAANPDGIYAQDDMVAYGLIAALKDKTHNIKAIFGAAGYQPYLRLMKTSAIDLGSATYSPQNIETCVVAAVNLTKGIKPPQKKIVITAEMITKENVDQYLKIIGNF